MKTIKIFNESNVNLNFEFEKVTNVDFYGTDADFNVIAIDKETGIVIDKTSINIHNIFQGFDTCEDLEFFFEEKELDGDEYDWELPKEYEEEFNEYLNDRYSEYFDEFSNEEIADIINSSSELRDLYSAIGFNDYLYYINSDNEAEFIRLGMNINGYMYIADEDVSKVFDLNTEEMIYKYKNLYFSFRGNFNYGTYYIHIENLRRTNEKKKITRNMVENYGISSLSYDLVGKIVYMYEEI